jgi:hypothetical protein
MQTSETRVFQTQPELLMTGPERDGIRFCLQCGQEFGPNEQWLKHESPDGSYAVGLHAVNCVMQNGFVRRGEQVCSVCGYPSKQADQMTAHFATHHGVTDPKAVAGLTR